MGAAPLVFVALRHQLLDVSQAISTILLFIRLSLSALRLLGGGKGQRQPVKTSPCVLFVRRSVDNAIFSSLNFQPPPLPHTLLIQRREMPFPHFHRTTSCSGTHQPKPQSNRSPNSFPIEEISSRTSHTKWQVNSPLLSPRKLRHSSPFALHTQTLDPCRLLEKRGQERKNN